MGSLTLRGSRRATNVTNLLHIETERLVLRRPRLDDAEDVFGRYASDVEATRYMAWPRHETLEQTRAFLVFSDTEWEKWPAGPLLIHARGDGRLLGSTGYAFEDASTAATGYILARDSWGQGYATEALRAIVAHAPALGIRRLQALCHADHRASWHVLEKCGFSRQAGAPPTRFPNLGELCDARYYVRTVP
jgi:[ribosomal protein S5]-alanine N-acetyltransferase